MLTNLILRSTTMKSIVNGLKGLSTTAKVLLGLFAFYFICKTFSK